MPEEPAEKREYESPRGGIAIEQIPNMSRERTVPGGERGAFDREERERPGCPEPRKNCSLNRVLLSVRATCPKFFRGCFLNFSTRSFALSGGGVCLARRRTQVPGGIEPGAELSPYATPLSAATSYNTLLCKPCSATIVAPANLLRLHYLALASRVCAMLGVCVRRRENALATGSAVVANGRAARTLVSTELAVAIRYDTIIGDRTRLPSYQPRSASRNRTGVTVGLLTRHPH
jgi:hypothetical protein